MVQLTFKSPGVGATEIDLTGPVNAVPIGIPAGIIGTAQQGKAFVPITLASIKDFKVMFGDEGNAGLFGPIAVAEWLRNAQAVTFLRVLGIGKGEQRTTTGNNAGRVESAGFVVGAQQPDPDGVLTDSEFANAGGPPGRVHFLGCYMSESVGSTIFSEAGRQSTDIPVPIIRGVLMAASGVVPMLAESTSDTPPASTLVANAGLAGSVTGTVTLLDGTTAKQEFVLFLNGHKGVDSSYPRVITASFDQTAPNYFGNVLNTDPSAIEKAGHYLYARYDVHSQYAVVTASALMLASVSPNVQNVAFLVTGSSLRNEGSSTAPSYENWEDRFRTPASVNVISQRFGGTPVNLFKVHALSDGVYSNERIKISIESIAKSNIETNRYGTFTLLVRDFYDTDENKIVLERFNGLSLDPMSDRYIAKIIGDMNVYFEFDKRIGSQKLRQDGQYENMSRYIRVEMAQNVDDGEVDPTALPMGFRGARHLVVSGTAPISSPAGDNAWHQDIDASASFINRVTEPPVPFRRTIHTGTGQKINSNKDLYWGVQFEEQISLTEPNLGKRTSATVVNMTKYFPNFQTSWEDFLVGDNEGTADTAANGIMDADRYNNNMFTLENLRVVTGSDGVASVKDAADWEYVRQGNISIDATAKTRAFSATTDLASLAVRNVAKFTFFLQGGFDGVNMFDLDAAEFSDKTVVEEMNYVARGQNNGPTVKTYIKALELMGNTSEVDVKILAVPGIRHEVVTDQLIDTTEVRFDAMAVLDIEERDTLNNVVTSSIDQQQHVGNTATAFLNRALDSSFAAAYYPDVVMIDPFSGLEARVPPSVAVLGAISLTDAISRPWQAPAGYTRGLLQTTTDVAVNFNRRNLDDLYSVDINPITKFPGADGIVVWGQKTLLSNQSALDRVNVRRLMIELRRQIRQVGNRILFEQHREAVLAQFSALVNPVLQRIQDQQGINGFRVIIDASTTTQADIENNVVKGKIYVQPTKSVEFIDLDFVITNQGGLS